MVFLTVSAVAQIADPKKKAPEEKITVKKEYDENGNLIGFDSLRIWSWSGDSALRFQFDSGWEKFFGHGSPDEDFGFPFQTDSLFPDMPFSKFHFGVPEHNRLFGNFYNEPDDSAFFKNFLFHTDTSFFMGPNSSFLLPPGFFIPDMKGLNDLEEFLEDHFRSLLPANDPNGSDQDAPFRRFIDPGQQEEWEKLMQKQQEELKEFNKKWEKQNKAKGTEKM
jgi:hypothetical protein